MLSRLLKAATTALECSQNERKYIVNDYRKSLEECIETMNQVQDAQKIKHMTEADKDNLVNTLINNARTKFVIKLLELDNISKHSNSNK